MSWLEWKNNLRNILNIKTFRQPLTMNKHIFITLFSLTLSFAVSAQTDQPWEKYYNQLYDIDDIEAGRLEDYYDELSELYENKFDINSATREDLERLPFLTQEQIEEISEYVYFHAPLRSIGDLAMIESLDARRRALLQHFIYFGNEADKDNFPSLSNILKYGRHELTATAKLPLYDRAGDNNGYLGYKYKHWMRYTFKLGQYVSAGFVGSQDSGEPFFANRNKWGYDYYSFYLLVRKLGRIKALSVGRYKLKFGMGLILNNNFSFGKISALSTPNTNNIIRAQSSRSESTYLQGAAATLNVVKHLDVTAFASCRKVDATLSDDGTSITTLLTTGYHRTRSELDRKHSATQSLLGGNLGYDNQGFHLGTTVFYATFDKTISPNKQQVFRQHYPSGKHFWNASIDYGYTHYRFSFNGETATGNSGGIATLNRLTFQASQSLSLIAIQRFYAVRFNSLFSEAFSDGGKVQNESGVYFGATWTPSPYFTATAYTDYAYFAWPRYGISQASHSSDNFISATLKQGNLSWTTRYHLRIRQQDNEDKTYLINKYEHRARTSLVYEDGPLKASIQGDLTYSRSDGNSFGWMVAPNLAYAFHRISLSAWVAYFDTDDYQSRIYTYERSMMYNFSFPMFYGNGMRLGIHAKTDIIKNVTLMGKIAMTKYFDRNKISSGYQEINSSSMTDIDLQLRWKF